MKKNKRTKNSRVASKSFKSYICQSCRHKFKSIHHFREHVNSNISCKRKLDFCCKTCNYIGYNQTGLDLHLMKKQSCNKRSTSSVNRISRPRFILKATFEDTDNENEIRNINVKVDWGGITRTPVLNFPHELLKRIANRLFIGSPHIGGKVDTNSSIPGYTEIVKDEVIYRAHPCYTNKGCWYDWAYFEWEGYENPIPARIMMILDLTDINIIYDIDCDPDNLTHDPDNVTLKHLTNEKWMVVLAAEISQENFATSLSDDHFDSRIGTRLKLHSDSDMWLVPVKCLVGPCFVIYNKKYIVDVTREDMIDDRTAYVIEPMKNWASKFLSANE